MERPLSVRRNGADAGHGQDHQGTQAQPECNDVCMRRVIRHICHELPFSKMQLPYINGIRTIDQRFSPHVR